MQKLTLGYYKTNHGMFIKDTKYSSRDWCQVMFNGSIIGHNATVGGFLRLPIGVITKVAIKSPKITRCVGYTLLEDTPAALQGVLQPYYSSDDAKMHYDDDLDEYVSKNPDMVLSMYRPVYETIEGTWDEVEFEAVCLGELTIENYGSPETMKITQCTSINAMQAVDLSTIVEYSDIERMLTPEFMLHTRPCSLSSKQVYHIIRAHVKNNINPTVAEITSDHNFVFEVKKKVMVKPQLKRKEIKKKNGQSYATPKFATSTTTYHSIPLFKMTHANDKWKDYPVIAGWNAENLEDMKAQIKVYLDALMDEINSEVVECEHCQGTGNIVHPISHIHPGTTA